jgi:hypothetical protein
MIFDSPQAPSWTHPLTRAATSGNRRRNYDPSQPRVPAGHPDGGQWTVAGSRFLSEPFSRLAFALADGRASSEVGSAHNVPEEFNLPLINVHYSDQADGASNGISSAIEGRDWSAPGQFRQYAELNEPSPADERLIEETTQELKKILLRVNGTISRRRDPISARLYRIAVHKAFADAVRARNLPGIGRAGVEQSFDLDGLARYGLDGSIRTDVVLRNREGVIIAIYDVKTGNATMRPSREAKIRKYTKAARFVPVIILHARRGGI